MIFKMQQVTFVHSKSFHSFYSSGTNN